MTTSPQLAAPFSRYLKLIQSQKPQEASRLGLEKCEHRLGPNTAASKKEFETAMRGILQEIESVPESAMQSGDAWLERRGFLSLLRTQQWEWEESRQWQKNPGQTSEEAMDSLFDPVLRSEGNLAPMAAAFEARLAEIPRFLKEGLKNLQKPVPLWTRLAVLHSRGAAAFLQGLKPDFAAAAPRRKKLAEHLDAASAAFVEYGKAVKQLSPGKPGSFAVGAEGLGFLIRERLGLDESPQSLRALAEDSIATLKESILHETRKLGKMGFRPGPDGDLIRAIRSQWQPEGTSLLDAYRKVTGEIRATCERTGLFPMAERERLDVQPVPEFLRHQFPTAAYLQPPPFSDEQRGIFWVNDLGAAVVDPKRRAREIQQHFGLELTAAHEAVPGHHLQFVWQHRHPSHLRRLFAHAIGYEGWTLWCENEVVEKELIKAPWLRLLRLHDALWRAHRILVDCGLQAGSWSVARACRHLVDELGFTPARAAADVNWYSAAPSVPMSYWLGFLEMQRLHAFWQKSNLGSSADFHRWFLQNGAIPQRWLWESRLFD